MSTHNQEAGRAAPELMPCPMCGGQASVVAMEGYQMAMCECGVNYEGPSEEDCIEAWNRRPAVAYASADGLPPIEYDRDLDRTYIPLPGGWEVQTKGKGSTFRIAHIGSRKRWMVLDDDLHEMLEGMARDVRNALAAKDAEIAALSRQHKQSVDSQEFQELAGAWAKAARGAWQEKAARKLWLELVSYIDTWAARSAGEAVPLLREARAALETWKDVAPAVSLCADIDRFFAAPASGDTAKPQDSKEE